MATTFTAATSSRSHEAHPPRQQQQTNNAFLFCSPDESSLHHRLRKNDPEFTDLQLWLNASSNVGSLTDALEDNTAIQDVCLLIHESFGQVPALIIGEAEQRMHHYHHHHDVLDLFAVVGRLPQLQHLFLNTYRFPFVATLPVQAFASAFQGAHQLVELKLWRTNLYGCRPEDLEAWAQALASGCRNLQTFKLIQCRLIEEGEEEAILNDTGTFGTLDSILCALATLPQLVDVELSATKLSALGTLAPASLKQLLGSSTSLQSFSLMHFDLSEGVALAIAEALLPQQQQPQQQQVETSPEYEATRQSNNNIKHVKLKGVGSTATMFRKPLRDAFQMVLQNNYVLETLFLFDQRNLQDDIRFYLKLNRLGRNRLFQHRQYKHYDTITDKNKRSNHYDIITNNESRSQEWIDILALVRDDFQCLFYFLHECPLLLSGNGYENNNNR